MANKEKGEVSLTCGNTEYTLRFSTNSLCELEDASGMGVMEIGEKFDSGKFGIKDLRVILWAGLRDYHKELSMENVGEIIDVVTMEKAMEVTIQSFQLAFPENKKKKVSKKK